MNEHCERFETKATVINYIAARDCVRACGGNDLYAATLLGDHVLHDRHSHRALRQIHVITDSSGLPEDVFEAFDKAGATIHRAHGDRTEALTFLHTIRMAEIFDVVTLFVTDSGYLPMVRHAKALGCRVELYGVWTSDPALLVAADGVVAIHPVPGAPLVLPTKLSEAA